MHRFRANPVCQREFFRLFGGTAGRVCRRLRTTTARAQLAQSGMKVVADVDRAKFAEAMASANLIFAQQFGSNIIKHIREYS